MPRTFTIAVFEGDGIGPEVMAPTQAILRGLAGAAPDYALAFTGAARRCRMLPRYR